MNIAEVPAPSAHPLNPFPAIVDTNPVGDTTRIAWLPISAIRRLPEAACTAMPHGPQNPAAVPSPPVNAQLPFPAKVLTTPSGDTARIR